MKLFLASAFALCLCLASCAGYNASQNVEVACTSAATAYQVLGIVNRAGKLPDNIKQEVIKSEPLIDYVCSPDTPPSLSSAEQAAFIAAIAYLEKEAALYGSKK